MKDSSGSRLSSLYLRLDGALARAKNTQDGDSALPHGTPMADERRLHALVIFWFAIESPNRAHTTPCSTTSVAHTISRDEEDDAMAWAADDSLY
jgi:hypothetical protein